MCIYIYIYIYQCLFVCVPVSLSLPLSLSLPFSPSLSLSFSPSNGCKEQLAEASEQPPLAAEPAAPLQDVGCDELPPVPANTCAHPAVMCENEEVEEIPYLPATFYAGQIADMEVEEIPYLPATNCAGQIADMEVEEIPFCKEPPAQDVERQQAEDRLSISLSEPAARELTEDRKVVTPEKRASQPAPPCITPPLKRLRGKTSVVDGVKPVPSPPGSSGETSAATCSSPESQSQPACPAHLYDLADKIRDRDMEAFARLQRMKLELAKKKCPKGKVPDMLTSCHICKATKHRNKWLEKDRLVTGGICYCCYRASILLGCSRSPTLLESSQSHKGFLEVSLAYRHWLGARDVCKCKKCAPKEKKKKKGSDIA